MREFIERATNYESALKTVDKDLEIIVVPKNMVYASVGLAIEGDKMLNKYMASGDKVVNAKENYKFYKKWAPLERK